MKGTFKFKHPIHVQGELVKELEYDSEKVTNEAYLRALADTSTANSKNSTVAIMPQADYTLLLNLGALLLTASNPGRGITSETFKLLRGADNSQLLNLGYLFIVAADGEETQESSEEPSAATPSVSTPQPETSET